MILEFESLQVRKKNIKYRIMFFLFVEIGEFICGAFLIFIAGFIFGELFSYYSDGVFIKSVEVNSTVFLLIIAFILIFIGGYWCIRGYKKMSFLTKLLFKCYQIERISKKGIIEFLPREIMAQTGRPGKKEIKLLCLF